MNVLVLNGSPKTNSDTMHLTRAFLAGLGGDAKIINVIEKDIAPCTGCFGCWAQQQGRCVIGDDQNGILADMIDSDVIVWSFPLYYYGMPSHLKAVLDRTIPLAKMSMKEVDGRVVHDSLVDMSAKKYVVITGCGFPNWDGNFDGLKQQCRQAFGEELTMVCVPETPMLNVPSAAPLTAPLLERFRAAGAEFAASGSLAPETVAALEIPMLPNEIYIQIVNSQ